MGKPPSGIADPRPQSHIEAMHPEGYIEGVAQAQAPAPAPAPIPSMPTHRGTETQTQRYHQPQGNNQSTQHNQSAHNTHNQRTGHHIGGIRPHPQHTQNSHPQPLNPPPHAFPIVTMPNQRNNQPM